MIEHVKYGGNALEGTLKVTRCCRPWIRRTAGCPGSSAGQIYQWVVTQIGRLDVDILLSSLVWEEMGPMHAAMATFRAVENGVVVVRQEDQGRSMAVDSYGRTLATADHFAGERILQVDVPVASSVTTVYPQLGDMVGDLAQPGLLVMAVWAIIAGRRTKKKIDLRRPPSDRIENHYGVESRKGVLEPIITQHPPSLTTDPCEKLLIFWVPATI